MADITHHPMDQLQDLEYCIDSNPPWGMPSLFVYICFVRGSFLSLTFFFIWLRNFESEMGLWDNIYSCKVVFFFPLSLSIQCFVFSSSSSYGFVRIWCGREMGCGNRSSCSEALVFIMEIKKSVALVVSNETVWEPLVFLPLKFRHCGLVAYKVTNLTPVKEIIYVTCKI